MRNDSHKWQPVPAQDPEPIRMGSLEITAVTAPRQLLISGSQEQILNFFKLDKLQVWPEPVIIRDNKSIYAVPLRRDRLLIINGKHVEEGWDEERGLAVSEMSHGYRVIDVSGPGAFDLLRRGTELDQNIPSGSAIREFKGFEILLYPVNSFKRFRLHTRIPDFPAFWMLLQQLAMQTNSHPSNP